MVLGPAAESAVARYIMAGGKCLIHNSQKVGVPGSNVPSRAHFRRVLFPSSNSAAGWEPSLQNTAFGGRSQGDLWVLDDV